MSGFWPWKKTLSQIPSLEDICAAMGRISPSILATPLTHSPILSEALGHEIYFKWENKHRTGSFKERGALNFLLTLDQAAKAKGICAASAGNHSLALAYYSAKLNIACEIVMPVNAALVKVQATTAYGAKVIMHGRTFDEAKEFALDLSKDSGKTFVPAFDHPSIISGQATIGLEILEQLADFDSVVVPIGGGGLISGIALALKEKKPDVFILGVQSEWVLDMRKNTKSSSAFMPMTIADGIGVKTPGLITQQIIDQKVDKIVSVSEAQIGAAIIDLLEKERVVVEGAGAASLAAISAKLLPANCKKTVVLISGSNMDINLLSRLIERDLAVSGRLIRLTVSVPDRPGSLHFTTGILAEKGANVLQVIHDRSFSHILGNVDIAFLLEIRSEEHKTQIIETLQGQGLSVISA